VVLWVVIGRVVFRKSGNASWSGQNEGEEEREREILLYRPEGGRGGERAGNIIWLGWVGLGKEGFVSARMMELPIEQLHEKTMIRV